MNRPQHTLGILLLALVTACGGGGGSSGPTVALAGTAATGAAMSGAVITVVDANGVAETCSSPSAADGSYACTLRQATVAPLIVQAAVGETKVHAVVSAANNQTINITPISDMMAQKYAASTGLSASELVARPEQAKVADTTAAKTAATTAIEVVKNVVTQIAQTAGGGVTIQDPLTGRLTPGSSTDNLDKLLSTLKFAASGDEFKIYIPSSNGDVVTVTVAYSKSATEAQTIASNQASAATLEIDKGQSFEAGFKKILTAISSGSAENLIAQLGFAYDQGRTPEDYANMVITNWRNFFGQLTLTSLEKIAIDPMTGAWVGKAAINSSNGGSTEIVIGLKDFGNSANPNWKMVGDELPSGVSLELRHSLSTRNNAYASDPTAFSSYFSRRINSWIDTDFYDESQAPKRLLVSVLRLEDRYNNNTPVDFTLYKPDNVNNCTMYSSEPNNCANFVVNEGTALFERMAYSQTKFVIKAVDNNGACMNCDANGIPKTITYANRAYSVAKLFGGEYTESALKNGVSKLSEKAKSAARVYFAAPSDAAIEQFITSAINKNFSTDLTLSWARPTLSSNRQINDLWAGAAPCAGNWTSFEDPKSLWAQAANSYTWKNKGATLNRASWIDTGYKSNVGNSEFEFNLGVNLKCN